MKLKILVDSPNLADWTGPAEEVLSETAASFGHSLNVTYGFIGAEAVRREGVSVSQNTVDECTQNDGTLLFCRSAEVCEEFLETMDASVLLHVFDTAETLEDHRKSRNCLAVVQSLDEECIADAARAIRNFATVSGVSFQCVPPNGSAAGPWKDAFLSASLLSGSNVLSEISAGEAIRGMIRSRENYGLITLPPYAGGILTAAAMELTNAPWLVRSMCCGLYGIYVPRLPEAYKTDIRYLFSPILSVADFFEYSCHLYREASCIRASVCNVLKEYAGDPVAGGRENSAVLTGLICEQISLAGQLLNH